MGEEGFSQGCRVWWEWWECMNVRAYGVSKRCVFRERGKSRREKKREREREKREERERKERREREKQRDTETQQYRDTKIQRES